VLRTRAEAIGIDLHISPIAEFELASAFGMLISWPSSSGNTSHVSAVTSLVLSAREIGVVSVAATDLLACTLSLPQVRLASILPSAPLNASEFPSGSVVLTLRSCRSATVTLAHFPVVS
jgi:hypothetical protein